MRKIQAIAALALLLVVLIPASGPASGPAEDVPMIKLGHVGHDHQLALYVAAEAGKSLEDQYGVYLKELKPQEVYDLYDGGRLVARVQMVLVGGGSKMPAALEQGHIDVGLGGLGPVAKFVDKGSPLKVLAPLNNDGDALIVRKGLNAASWDEFIVLAKESEKPLKIGYKDPMAVAFMIFSRALREEGVSFGQEPVGPDGKAVKVLMVNLQGLSNALPSLESGIVDGVVVNEPMGSILVHKEVGRQVADLSTLPPKGKWEGHPCCVVAAREDALEEKRATIVSLLKVIAAGADLMAIDDMKALEAEAAWTRTDPEIGRMSIANVSYVFTPDEEWLRGVDTWIELMISSGHFGKDLKGKKVDEIRGRILDLSPMNEALSAMKISSQ